jgi:hypothetical protein
MLAKQKNDILWGFFLSPDVRSPKTIGLSGVCRVFSGKLNLLKFFLEI